MLRLQPAMVGAAQRVEWSQFDHCAAPLSSTCGCVDRRLVDLWICLRNWCRNRNDRNELFLKMRYICDGKTPRFRGDGDLCQGGGAALLRGGRAGSRAL